MTATRPPEDLTGRLSAAWRSRAVGLKAVSFALVGLVNFGVDFGVFSFAHLYLGWPIAAESGRQLRVRDYATFALSQAGGLIANTATVFALSFFMPVLVGKALAIGASFVVNFSLSHFVVFRRRRTTNSC
jgi:putative flippase GtrA